MFILSESCSPGLWKTENIFLVCAAFKLLSWREKLVDYCTRRRSYRRRLSDLRVPFYSCFKVHLFRIPASKRICMNVGVFQNKAKRKNPRKLHSRANETACEGPNAVGKCIRNAYSRLQLRLFRVPVFQYTLGWSKTPDDHPEVYRGPDPREQS